MVNDAYAFLMQKWQINERQYADVAEKQLHTWKAVFRYSLKYRQNPPNDKGQNVADSNSTSMIESLGQPLRPAAAFSVSTGCSKHTRLTVTSMTGLHQQVSVCPSSAHKFTHVN
jgi:hypothetical protein